MIASTAFFMVEAQPQPHWKQPQELVLMEQELLYGTFIDLKKVYNTIDHDICLEILEDYGIGP